MSTAPDARSLFAAARADGPDDEARDDMFRRVALVSGMAGASATAAAAASTAPAGAAVKAAGSAVSMKLLAIGGLIGAAGTALGVLLTIAIVEPRKTADRRDRPDFTAQNGSLSGGASGYSRAPTIGARRAETSPRARDPEQTQTPTQTPTQTQTPTPTPTPTQTQTPTSTRESDLAEEVRLVTEARKALVGGDAARALAMVQATRKLGSRSMEPEEMGLEARALRALGRADEAAATELLLRRRFPDHALAR